MDFDDLDPDDPLRIYLRETAGERALSSAEEADCIAAALRGGSMAERAKKRLIEGNLELVVRLALEARGSRVHVLDLIQRGNEGLFRAVKTLHEMGDATFGDFVRKHIRRALTDSSLDPPSRMIH